MLGAGWGRARRIKRTIEHMKLRRKKNIIFTGRHVSKINQLSYFHRMCAETSGGFSIFSHLFRRNFLIWSIVCTKDRQMLLLCRLSINLIHLRSENCQINQSYMDRIENRNYSSFFLKLTLSRLHFMDRITNPINWTLSLSCQLCTT